jgi:hypothetical protein
MALIAGLIKQIGGLKKDGKDVNAGEEGSKNDKVDVSDDAGSSGAMMKKGDSGSSDNGGDDNGGNKEGFLKKAGTWVKEHPIQATVVGVGTAALIYAGVKHFSKKKEQPKALSGEHHKKHKKHESHKHQKQAIALL